VFLGSVLLEDLVRCGQSHKWYTMLGYLVWNWIRTAVSRDEEKMAVTWAVEGGTE
jgi:hypothetical protein